MARKRNHHEQVLRALAAFRKRARRSGDPEGAALARRLIRQELTRYSA